MHRFIVLAIIFPALSLAASAQEAPRFRTVPWAAWVAAGTDFDGYSLAVGIRRDVFGLGFGYYRSTENEPPQFSSDTPPPGVVSVPPIELEKAGADLYTVQHLTDWLGGYASIGLYVNINTVLVRDTATGRYYASPDHPDWTKPQVQFGAGLELQPLEWMIVGVGWHAVRGVNVHLGYRW